MKVNQSGGRGYLEVGASVTFPEDVLFEGFHVPGNLIFYPWNKVKILRHTYERNEDFIEDVKEKVIGIFDRDFSRAFGKASTKLALSE